MGDKRCCRCDEVKPRSHFYRNAKWSDGLHPYCKPCLLAYQRDKRLQRLDAERPDRRRWTKWSLRHDFFQEIDEAIKAYLLGLIAADGSVLSRPARLSLELSMRDKGLVELARDTLAPGVPVRGRPARGSTKAAAVLSVTSRQLVGDLARWGVVPRKTWRLKWPGHLARDMQRPFLLGYFDGDGYVTTAHRYRGGASGRWGLCGTRSFLEGAMAFITAETEVRPRTPRLHVGVFKLHIDGRDALSVDRWLHGGLELGLRRKQLSALLAPDPR